MMTGRPNRGSPEGFPTQGSIVMNSKGETLRDGAFDRKTKREIANCLENTEMLLKKGKPK